MTEALRTLELIPPGVLRIAGPPPTELVVDWWAVVGLVALVMCAVCVGIWRRA